MIIFEEISAIAFQNGIEHLSTTSGREMTVISFQENIVFLQNSVDPIGAIIRESIDLKTTGPKICPVNKRL